MDAFWFPGIEPEGYWGATRSAALPRLKGDAPFPELRHSVTPSADDLDQGRHECNEGEKS